ncbi:subclass B3 metallo-beta-lactamase [Novosphingobium mangrovi (ex Huang et al. 2023)]|uniref:Subclass B3 metallo-beta-lactamase n=1 Tax=Novosphingobium mangrovi (ex Huang et al. 2023) TaxID=2976432 RepID=A0ABT2I7C4_9SPHN|nr:subclass B3 metallo-beta-lactamase [Novosphingobium mangrovi (ex Huang et al. 2023)]MCT2400699.1 subclass B3 metallo-beta-lactamase [Novosphingobium mangrovi (ex Huang et al. 2023)]
MNRSLRNIALAALLAAAPAMAHAKTAAPAPHTGPQLAAACNGHDGWTDPAPPAHIFGNTWYVGTCGISAILITGDDGHVLIDGGMAEAAPLVLANIAALGFDPADVRWIILSHEHFDHAGALAALKRATGAKLAALAPAAKVLETGIPDPSDPQYGMLKGMAPVATDRVLVDGDSLVLGRITLTVHATPAHSPGSASWTWQSCTGDFTCLMIAYADSATAISADAYRFTDHEDRVAQVREGLSRIARLPCDILLTPHPSASGMMERFAGKTALVDSSACRSYAAAAQHRFEARLAREAGDANEARP